MSDPSHQSASALEDAQASLLSAETRMDALKISEMRYRRLFEAARDGILLLDSNQGRITDANPFMSELLGYSHQEMLGKELWEIGLLQDKEASQEAFRQLRQDNYIRYENLPLQTQTGESRAVEFVSNLYRENGHTVIQCNIRDITEHRRVAAELAAVVARHGHQSAVLEERDRLAREIHDTLAQGFIGITTQMEAAEAALAKAPESTSPESLVTCQAQLEKVQVRIGKARDLARESLAEVRRFVAALRSPLLEAAPLSEALARFLILQVLGTATKSRYVLEGVPYALPASIEHCLLRIGQEAIANAVTHAQAHEIHVELSFETKRVRLRVRDDGHGFDPSLPGWERFGIIGMRERAQKAQGTLTLVSRPGEGTTVDLTIPLPQEAFLVGADTD